IQYEATEPRGVDIEFVLGITPEARMEVIFDKTWGDAPSGAREGEATVIMKRDGHVEVNGGVEVSQGACLVDLMKLGLHKPFAVAPAGTISWSGDPYNADITIDALYTGANASIYSLIQEYISVASTETQDRARGSTPVRLEMNLSGKLLTPDIKFDISFPE